MIRIRAFRAIDDIETCERYLEGHRRVLIDFKIAQITTNNSTWFYNPMIYVIVAESADGREVYGGTRIQVKEEQAMLPVEEALYKMDPAVLNWVQSYRPDGIGELCGLWSSRKVSGLGYSVLLTRAAIARASIVVLDQLYLKAMLVLCGPYTVNLALSMGFVIEESIGDKGSFIYPRPDLLARVLIIKDMQFLNSANPKERNDILSLRQNLKQVRIEKGVKGNIEVEYDLQIFKK